MPLRFMTLLVLLATGLASAPAQATEGYFDYGYGVKAKGGGGAGVAFAQDGLAPASNPAGNAFVSDQINVGASYFRPDRGAQLGPNSFDGNGDKTFWIPEAAWRQAIGSQWTVGLAAFGNGGLNTSYGKPIFGTTNTGIDLSQLFVAPTATYTFLGSHAFGVSAVLAYQRFKATGLQGFGLADQGTDTSYGAGARLGYTGRITEWLSVGLTYQSRIDTSRFDKYAQLFAEHGDFDVPANFAAGIAVRPWLGATLALDVERIQFSSVKSVGNKNDAGAGPLGADNGPGFGWRDVTAIKLGASYDLTREWTVRAGYNHSSQPITPDQTTFNVLAPAVVQHHYTAGASWRATATVEISAFFAYVPETTVHGDGSASGSADLHMKQTIVGLGGALTL